MNRRWLCSDVWMDILPSFDHAQLGLKMALLSDRFDVLVDKHFDRKSELTIWREIIIRGDKGQKPLLSVEVDGKFVDFPLPDDSLPNKIRFNNLQIQYIDHSVIKFLRSKKRFFDKSGTNLELFIDGDQLIWEVFVREIWPILTTNIRHLHVPDANHLDNLRRHISPTILTDLDQVHSIDSVLLRPDVLVAHDDEATSAGQALSKWLHTPRKDGQPNRFRCIKFLDSLNLEWLNNFKETFLRATTSVSYKIHFKICLSIPPIVPLELVNEWTQEKLTLKSVPHHLCGWLMKRCSIVGETAADQWENYGNWDDNLNTVTFDLWHDINKSIGPLSPPTEEENEEADESNEN